MKMECSGKREIRGEVKKEWMESVEEWKSVEEKEVRFVKREESVDEMNVHMSKATAFEVNGQRIRCLEKLQSWIIDRELKSVCELFINIFICLLYLYLYDIYICLYNSFVGSISIVCDISIYL